MIGSQPESDTGVDESSSGPPPRYELLHRAWLWQSPWYSLRQDRLRDESGHEFNYTVVDHPGSVVILPVTREGQVVLIRSYRYPVNEFCLELPAGGMGLDPTPEAAAERELDEEVGGRADRLQYVGRFYPSNGISNEQAHVFLATGVVLGECHRESTEKIELVLVRPDEALQKVRAGEILDGRAIVAILWCASHLG